jgi:hypothetical protein
MKEVVCQSPESIGGELFDESEMEELADGQLSYQAPIQF